MEWATVGWFATGWLWGGFVSGITGFGAAMAAMPLVMQGMSLTVAVPACSLMTMVMGIEQNFRYKSFTDWPRVLPLLVGAVPGAFAGVLALQVLSSEGLKTALGVFLFCYALWGLFLEKGRTAVVHKAWGYVAGFFSTTFGTAFSFNGPPLAVYASLSGWDKSTSKAGFGVCFIGTSVLIIAFQSFVGMHGVETLLATLVGTPCALVGAMLGLRAGRRLSERVYRKLLFGFIGLTGGIFLLQTARAMLG